ncbi:MAG: TetR/AcrR family transcriptional regulator [Anaerolineales bacterium]|nr:TetR/AcrR family transcriptional regulator [Anaerolineales bacterium]
MNQKKIDILQAALEEFSQKSFDDASVNEIIKISETSKGTFYHYFQDKKDLYIQLMKAASETKWKFIQAEMAKQAGEDTPADIFELFKQQAQYGIQFAEQYPAYHALARRFSGEKDNAIYAVVLQELEMAQEDEEILAPIFAQAYQEGVFNTQFPLDFIKRTVLFLFNHFDEIYSDSQAAQEDTLTDLYNLIEFMRHGFG